MGLIRDLLMGLFGSNQNVLRETVEVFRENREAGANRDYQLRSDALSQFAEEFRPIGRSPFDRIMDGLNRLPRPFLALGTVGLLISAMTAPDWFSTRMAGLALVPEPLWWLLGVIVSFYFGARHQVKTQSFQKEIMATLAGQDRGGSLLPISMERKGLAEEGRFERGQKPTATAEGSFGGGENQALQDWLGQRT